MHLKYSGVNDAFFGLVSGIKNGSICTASENSRNGGVLKIDEPVIITYKFPRQRVLFNRARDANCFFHLYEALHMLAGRNDLAPLAYYNSQIANYSDDGKTLNGSAYGYRWRQAKHGVGTEGNQWYGGSIPDYRKTVDQLNVIVDHLKANPTSRRAVLQMWNVEDDLLKIGGGKLFSGSKSPFHSTGSYETDVVTTDPGSKDVACNLCVMFSLRDQGKHGPIDYVLDMTVINRSNDMIWGMLGANYVHFTFLQEYMAARLGVEVGLYHHVTNNLHVYESNWKPDEWLAEYYGQLLCQECNPWWRSRSYVSADGPCAKCGESSSHLFQQVIDFPAYEPSHGNHSTDIQTGPSLVSDPVRFEEELPKFVDSNDGRKREFRCTYQEPFLQTVARPMMDAFYAYKNGSYAEAMEYCQQIVAHDWQVAATYWLNKRVKAKQEKTNAGAESK